MKGKPIYQQRFKRHQLIVLCGPYLNPNSNYLKKKPRDNQKFERTGHVMRSGCCRYDHGVAIHSKVLIDQRIRCWNLVQKWVGVEGQDKQQGGRSVRFTLFCLFLCMFKFSIIKFLKNHNFQAANSLQHQLTQERVGSGNLESSHRPASLPGLDMAVLSHLRLAKESQMEGWLQDTDDRGTRPKPLRGNC